MPISSSTTVRAEQVQRRPSDTTPPTKQHDPTSKVASAWALAWISAGVPQDPSGEDPGGRQPEQRQASVRSRSVRLRRRCGGRCLLGGVCAAPSGHAHTGRCDAAFAAPCLRGPVAGRHGRTGPAGLGLVRVRIRHVIEKSSETPGNCSKAFRYSWSHPPGNLLDNPRFSKGIQVLT